jgi:hypothetical protein
MKSFGSTTLEFLLSKFGRVRTSISLFWQAEKAELAARERVRQYQVNRLKYYYAVAEFDTTDTANQ